MESQTEHPRLLVASGKLSLKLQNFSLPLYSLIEAHAAIRNILAFRADTIMLSHELIAKSKVFAQIFLFFAGQTLKDLCSGLIGTTIQRERSKKQRSVLVSDLNLFRAQGRNRTER